MPCASHILPILIKSVKLLGILCDMIVCIASVVNVRYPHYPEQMVTSGVVSYTGRQILVREP